MVAILVLYAVLWADIQAPVAQNVTEKQLSLSAVNNAVQGGLVAVSILLPVSAGLLVLVIDKAKQGVVSQLLPHIRWACTYLFVSLVCGLWNLFRIPTMALQQDTDIAYDTATAIFEVLQLVFLLIGSSRLVLGIWSVRTAVSVTSPGGEIQGNESNQTHEVSTHE